MDRPLLTTRFRRADRRVLRLRCAVDSRAIIDTPPVDATAELVLGGADLDEEQNRIHRQEQAP